MQAIVPVNLQCGKHSTVKLFMCVLKPETSSTCSASSTTTACFFPSSSYPQPVSQVDGCFSTCAFQQALSLLYAFIPRSTAA